MTNRAGITIKELAIALQPLTETIRKVTEEDEQLKRNMDKYSTCK